MVPAPVVVWGNCQAEPVARLLDAPLRAAGLDVVVVPPVYLIDAAGLARVHDLVSRAAVLITQPIRDEYRIPGCGSGQLAALLPAGATLLTFPVALHTGPFPYQVNAHGRDGRVLAPVTDYHDLRALVAAEAGLSLRDALAWWPAPTADQVQRLDAASTQALRTREVGVDVPVSDLLDAPQALFTMTHPTNRTLTRLAGRLIQALALDARVDVPEREFLGARRAPIEPAVADALGWSRQAVRPHWIVDGRPVDPVATLQTQLDFYRDRPDVVADFRVRFADRLALLAL